MTSNSEIGIILSMNSGVVLVWVTQKAEPEARSLSTRLGNAFPGVRDEGHKTEKEKPL